MSQLASSPPELQDVRWLTGPAAERWLAEVGEHTGSLTSLTVRLRRELSAARVHLLLEQVELRQRAARKFAQADQMFFSRQLLEQSTDDQIASYKAERFADAKRIVDFCCGIGGDLMALARQAECLGVDRDPVAALLAAANCRQLGVRGETHAGLADPALVESGVAWHIDPDRRAAGTRTTRLESLQPTWETILALREQAADGGVKVAPATQADVPDGEREWIGSRGECRQQMIWWGRLAQHGGRTATMIAPNGTPTRLTGSPTHDAPCLLRPQEFLYEPQPVVLAADLAGQLAVTHGLAEVADAPGYLTGAAAIQVPLTSTYEVLEWLPFDRKRLRSLLRQRDWCVTAVKQRGAGQFPEQVLRALGKQHGQPVTLVLAGRRRGTWAAVTRRLQF